MQNVVNPFTMPPLKLSIDGQNACLYVRLFPKYDNDVRVGNKNDILYTSVKRTIAFITLKF